MSTTADLVAALKAELKASGVTYAELARELGVGDAGGLQFGFQGADEVGRGAHGVESITA